jgi:hypothetical protein
MPDCDGKDVISSPVWVVPVEGCGIVAGSPPSGVEVSVSAGEEVDGEVGTDPP